MDEKKLTDEEIVKALENCNNGYADMNRYSCDTCPYREIDPCGKAQMTDCLDLIHRLQSENEKLLKDYYAERQTCDEQKAEIERLTELQSRGAYRVAELGIEKAELQKQVDELTENYNSVINSQEQIFERTEKRVQQAVKDTAKEILQELWLETEATENDEWIRERIKEIAKRKGVEVE